MDKRKLLFFRWRYSDRCADFVLANKRLTEQGLAPFFDVVSIDDDCDFAEMVELHEPDLVLFESGSGTLPFARPRVRNTRAHPQLPRLGLLESDPHSGCRSVFLADMERLGVETFVSRVTSMAEYMPEIADRLLIWPWHLDEATFRDRDLDKTVVLTLTGACSPPYPWRERLFPLLAERYPTLRSQHRGYLRSQAVNMVWGEDYSRMLGASLFSASCGTAWKFLVKKHFEIAGSGCCLVAEDTPALREAGFVDMENCVLGDERDIPAKMDALLMDRPRLAEVTRAGVALLHERHLARHRPQIRQWLDLVAEHGPGADWVQDGPFGDVRPRRGPEDDATAHRPSHPEDRIYLLHARGLLARGEHRAAARLYQKMLDMAWHMPEPNLGLALCDLHVGLPHSARDRLRITLKWCMKQYRCHAPNPVEWAWMLVVQLCLGRERAARDMARRFGPGSPEPLRHTEFARACALLRVLDGETVAEEPGAAPAIACIHPPVHQSFADHLSACAAMLEACGRTDPAARLRTAASRRRAHGI